MLALRSINLQQYYCYCTDDKGILFPGPLLVSGFKVPGPPLPPLMLLKKLWKRLVPMVLKNYQFILKVRVLAVMPPSGFFVVKETMMST